MHNTSTLRRRLWQNRHFYLFISPFFLTFGVFGLYPLAFSFYLSFVKWDGLTDRSFVGIQNYITLFQDDAFYTSIWNTILIGLFYIPPMFLFAFLFANLLNSPAVPFRAFFRTALFLPCITPMVVIAIVFSLLFSTESGLLNYGLGLFTRLIPGLDAPAIPWLESEGMSKISLSILLVWRWTGYNMVLMLSGLQGIPDEYYEAARIDGASRWGRMLHITLPQLAPTLVFCTVTSLVGTVYMFEEVFVLTEGGPGMSSTNFGVYLFNVAFSDFRFGYASSAAYTVAAVVFVLTLGILRMRSAQAA